MQLFWQIKAAGWNGCQGILHPRRFCHWNFIFARFDTNTLAVPANKAARQHSNYMATAAKKRPQWFFRVVALHMTSVAPNEGFFSASYKLLPFLISFQSWICLNSDAAFPPASALGSVNAMLCSSAGFFFCVTVGQHGIKWGKNDLFQQWTVSRHKSSQWRVNMGCTQGWDLFSCVWQEM